MAVVNIIAFILTLIGALNWGLVGFFKFNLVSALFGEDRNAWHIVIYGLICLAGVWLIIAAAVGHGNIPLV